MPLTTAGNTYKKLLIPFSFIVLSLVAYVIDPNSFTEAWKGRVFYLFFLWLFTLEFILGDGNPNPESKTNLNQEWSRIILGTFVLMIPTIYLIEAHIFGLNNTIIEFGRHLGIQEGFLPYHWTISLEYIIVTISLFLGVLILLNFEGIKQFSVSIFLLGTMGAFYMIDTFRPYAKTDLSTSWLPPLPPWFTVNFQDFVPFTSSFVAFILPRINYAVQMVVLRGGGVQMLVEGAPQVFLIYWPCAGIHSLFIYTFVILLFLKGSHMSLAGKVVCLVTGAVGTFFVNVLRIVGIIDMFITSGSTAGEYFHNYYGELYFLGWIVIYLFALVFVQRFLTNTHNRAYASVALAAFGLGMLFSPTFFSYPLRSIQLVAFIAGMVSIGAGVILGVYTCFAYYNRKRTQRSLL